MCAQWHIFALILTISLTGYYITTAYIHLTESIYLYMKMKMLEITYFEDQIKYSRSR